MRIAFLLDLGLRRSREEEGGRREEGRQEEGRMWENWGCSI